MNIIKYKYSIILLIMFLFDPVNVRIANCLPVKYISSCQVDLNNDNIKDIVFLAETVRGIELMILLTKGNSGYETHVISKYKSIARMSCHYGSYIIKSKAGPGKNTRRISIPFGTYIKLTFPEASAVVYFLDGNDIKEVWIAD